jgi:hypothetical protein
VAAGAADVQARKEYIAKHGPGMKPGAFELIGSETGTSFNNGLVQII